MDCHPQPRLAVRHQRGGRCEEVEMGWWCAYGGGWRPCRVYPALYITIARDTNDHTLSDPRAERSGTCAVTSVEV
eukprot:2953667-Prymnesium_polylepis.1